MPNIVDIGSISVIEREIYQSEDAFFPGPDFRRTVQQRIIKEAFILHFNNNGLYRTFCEKKGISPGVVEANHRLIPVIPSTVFKTLNIRTDTGEHTVKRCISSGTQGSVSVIERDNTTLERFLGSVRNTIDNIYGIEDAVIMNLGPSADEAKDVWFSYVMSVSDMIFPTVDYVVNSEFMAARVIADLKKFLNNYRDVFVIGAPVMFLELYEYMKNNGIFISEGSKVFAVTAGGWKKNEARSISRDEFRNICAEMFPGIQKGRIRDVFNMVELNTIIPECECGSKHVPIWLDAYTIDLDTYGINEKGKEGLLVFLDAGAASYPGFVMSGDLGRISHVDDCPCGRNGITIEIIRRINTIESRGCALKIEKGLNKKGTEKVRL